MDKKLLNLKNTSVAKSNDIMKDVSNIINEARETAYQSVNVVLLKRNWLIGKRIYEEELRGTRAENYGKQIIKNLSMRLTVKYGKGFESINLYYFYRFYTLYKKIFYTPCKQSYLSWSHYRVLLTIENKKIRDWYDKQAIEGNWSVRTLQRNIGTDYYSRTLSAQKKGLETKPLIDHESEYDKRLEFVKNPVILEFLNIPDNHNLYKESDLENAIINHIQSFLLEMGKGYCFVGRQVRIHTDSEDYYIDLVFFNYILNCFVLIDLKTSKVTHQDVGQMDMYVRMYDELVKEPSHNPTLGIVLCGQTDENIAKYSILKGNEQIFASKYKLVLPDEKELKAEIEHQKQLFYLQNKNK